MRPLPFTKLSGAGNDFILLPGPIPPRKAASLAVRLCDRRRAIGADGLLIVNRTKAPNQFRMWYYNSDGSRAFCGNGSRCAARWIYSRDWSGKKMVLLSDEGVLPARILGPRQVRIRMPSPRRPRLRLSLSVNGRSLTAHFIHTGVPHAVVPVKRLAELAVEDLGRRIRSHPAFRPSGTNVDFIELAPGVIRLRTYERGVEAETLACGTGVTAAAIIAHLLGQRRSPVRVRTQSGDILSVRFEDRHGNLPRKVWLEGPACITFEGRFSKGMS